METQVEEIKEINGCTTDIKTISTVLTELEDLQYYARDLFEPSESKKSIEALSEAIQDLKKLDEIEKKCKKDINNENYTAFDEDWRLYPKKILDILGGKE